MKIFIVVEDIGSYDDRQFNNLEAYFSEELANAVADQLNNNRPEYNEEFARKFNRLYLTVRNEMNSKYRGTEYIDSVEFRTECASWVERLQKELQEQYPNYTHDPDIAEASYFVEGLEIVDCLPQQSLHTS